MNYWISVRAVTAKGSGAARWDVPESADPTPTPTPTPTPHACRHHHLDTALGDGSGTSGQAHRAREVEEGDLRLASTEHWGCRSGHLPGDR